VYEKYADLAEKLQVVTTKPKTFDDLVTCLKAGYAVAYGTNIELAKRNGRYYVSGSTAHCMAYAGYTGTGDCYHFNSWRDGKGLLSLDIVKKQWSARYFDCFVVLDIEREGRQGDVNWSLR
jgi:hypothetical protein